MAAALACVSKRGLPLPDDALALLGQFLRKPTPSALAIQSGVARVRMNKMAWLLFQTGNGRCVGWNRFVTSPRYFEESYCVRTHQYLFTHRKLNYTLQFCATRYHWMTQPGQCHYTLRFCATRFQWVDEQPWKSQPGPLVSLGNPQPAPPEQPGISQPAPLSSLGNPSLA